MSLTDEIRSKRISIMRDVIAQLDREENPLRLKTGIYFAGGYHPNPMVGDLQEHVDEVQKDCQFCLLASLLLSKARLYNEIPMRDLFSSSGNAHGFQQQSLTEKLSDIFDVTTLRTIESAFEMRPYHIGADKEYNYLIDAAAQFGYNFLYAGASVRARAVAQNIIDNDGVFTP